MTPKEKDQIRELRNRRFGYKKIASYLNLNLSTVKSFCRNNGLTESDFDKTFRCRYCQKKCPQNVTGKKKKFCSVMCKTYFFNHVKLSETRASLCLSCLHCGRNFYAYPSQQRLYCSRDCAVSARFKKGDYHDKD